MRLKTLAFFWLFVFTAAAAGQAPTASPLAPKWVRIESAAADFSVALPENGYLIDKEIDKEEDVSGIYFWANGVSFSVTMHPRSDAKEELHRWQRLTTGPRKYKLLESKDFLIRSNVPDSGLKEGSSVNLQLASSKGLYSISASARDSDDLTYSRLLRSVLINGAPLYAGAIINAAETEKISIAALSTHEDVLRALRMPDSRQRKLEKVPKGKKQNQEEDEKPIYSRSLAMLRKPRPGYTDAARMSGVQGTVVLQVTFLSTGEVGTIALVESLDRGLNNSAFSAAKRMKFLPAEIDGKPVDSVKNVEYSFWIY